MDTKPTTTPATLFFDVLRKLNKGHTPTDLSDALAKLTAAAADTGKKGKLTYTINVIPIKDTDGAYELRDDIKITTPKRSRKLAILYGTPDGLLASTPPDQDEFSFQRDASIVGGPHSKDQNNPTDETTKTAANA